MTTLTDELKEYRLSDKKIKQILATLARNHTVRNTSNREIVSIFVNDDSMAEIELSNGRTIERLWK